VTYGWLVNVINGFVDERTKLKKHLKLQTHNKFLIAFVNLQWLSKQTATIPVLPRLYQGLTKILPRLRLLNVIDVDFESVFLVVDGVEEPLDT